MAGIFFSWSSKDRKGAMRLRDHLRNVGFLSPNEAKDSPWRLWEYSDDMPTGSQIHNQVINVINRVRLAIICFSDATANAPWIEDEVAWCVGNLHSRDRELRAILPVWVGPHPENSKPRLIADRGFAVADASAGTEEPPDGAKQNEEELARVQRMVEEELERITQDVIDSLGAEAPIVVPAALFAMSERQCDGLLKGWAAGHDEQRLALQNLCLAMGMQDPPPLYERFRMRYGKTVEDFSPFYVPSDNPANDARPRLIDLVNRVVRTVNASRTTTKHDRRPPLYLRWVHHDLAAPGRSAHERARDRWSGLESLLIVDSISMLLPELRDVVRDLPDSTRSALLWLPPYTQHTVAAEKTLRASVGAVGRLGDALRQADKQLNRAIAFDTASPLTVQVWLMRTLARFVGDIVPHDETVDKISATAGQPIKLTDLQNAASDN